MAGETVITIVGNLTADPELRYTQAGKAVVNITIASAAREFDRSSNEWKDGDALFIRGSAWGEFAEQINGSLTKGMRVIAQGRLKQQNYETKEGEKRTSIVLDIDALGPDLRYATAVVSRRQTNQNQERNQQARQQPRPDIPAGQGQAAYGQQQSSPAGQQPAAAPPQQQADAWNTPGGYADETPF